MNIDYIANNCIFAYSTEFEALWGAISILTGEENNNLCSQIYGTDKIVAWKAKYRFLFEVFQIMKFPFTVGIFDFLLDIQLEDFSIAHYRKKLLDIPPEEFICRYLNIHFGSLEEDLVLRSFTEDAALDQVYSYVSDNWSSYLGFATFVRQSTRFIEDFFALATELDNYQLKEAFDEQIPKIEQKKSEVIMGIKKYGPMVCAEYLLRKSFHNRGAYTDFVYIPTLLLPSEGFRVCNSEGEPQKHILFWSMDQKHNYDDIYIQKALKAMSDGTRYQILIMLAANGPMRGMDIAKKLSIATSTVSHHMETLYEGRLITEKPIKNSKYYDLNKKTVSILISALKEDLLIDE